MIGPQVPALARRVVKRLLQRRTRHQPAPPPAPIPRKKKRKPPHLTVVVAVHNASQYLPQCLRSLQSQSLRRLEIIVVDDRSTDGSQDLLVAAAAEDRRIRVIEGPQVGVAGARNAGVAQARGDYLTFVNPQDTLPRTALATLVTSLQRTGSDFAVGSVQRVRNGRRTRPYWTSAVHQGDRPATTIDQFPLALQDLALFNRVFRKSFWISSVGPFPEDNDQAELLCTMGAYLRATSFDVLDAITYYWQRRSDHASIVQERFDHKTLDDRFPVLRRAWELIADSANPTARDAWLGGIMDTDLAAYCEQATTGDDAYRGALQDLTSHFLDLASEGALGYVRVDRRLRVWLAAHGRWDSLDALIEYFRLNGATPPTVVRGGRVFADLPISAELGDDLPQACFELAEQQTRLTTCVEKAYFNDAGLLEVQGWSFIRGIDLTQTRPDLEAWLTDSVSGHRLQLPVTPRVLMQATRWANLLNQNVDAAGFGLEIDVSELPPLPPGSGPQRWVLEVRNCTSGAERVGRVTSFVRSGVALRMRARDLPHVQDPVRYVPMLDPELGFLVQIRPDRVRAVGLTAGPNRHVSGRLRIINPIAVPIVGVRASTAGQQLTAPVREDEDGSLTFDFILPDGLAGPRRWNFRALGEDGRRYRVSWPDEATFGRRVGGSSEEAAWLRSSRGFCDLVTDRVALQAVNVHLSDRTITVEVETTGLSRADLQQAELRSPRATVQVLSVEPSERGHRLEFPATTEIWGTPDLALPPATYIVMLPELRVRCGISDQLLEQCPIFGVTPRHGYTLARVAGQDRLTINLRAPLADGDRGRFAQHRLTSWYQQEDFAPREAVLFQCYRGEFSTDSQRAIHEELWRRLSPLQLLWAVSSYSVPLPEGAVPLLIGSRDWYEAVASSRYLCQNIDYDRFFRKRPHQKYLQTFHGYPWKSMGISLWRAQGKSERLIAGECERRNSAWDSIVVPAEFCEELYRREYRYPHEVLVTGYPRDDALVTSDAAAVRAEVLTRLGIGLDKKVVLYAPTWRDTTATGAWTAKFFDALNLDQLTEELGDDYALLLRGHNYNLREGSVGSSASVLDVSSYPEVNDLILAADVAVLDYSSLRFDWLLTGKPVVFFVPDLANYLSARTVLFEYGPTAPGPMLNTTDEVVQALRQLDDVRRQYATARETFNLEFQGLHDGHATERVVDRFFGADSRPHELASAPELLDDLMAERSAAVRQP